MAKKKSFGTGKQRQGNSTRRMAKVIVAKKTANNKYGYREAYVDEGDVQNFIKENKD